MRIRILGAGWYGCHLAAALATLGHDVEIHESSHGIFAGASGKIPARLHNGAHYPRSFQTRMACRAHNLEFMQRYGHLTRGVPVNLYAIAANDSLVDFRQYRSTLRDEFEFITVHDPAEYGLANVEGAILTGERHIIADASADWFRRTLKALGVYVYAQCPPGLVEDPAFDLTIDCTFCANDSAGVDRYEPCLVLQLEGPADRAVTIMDGPFSSLYPWDPLNRLCSLSSAEFTPFRKDLRSYADARRYLDELEGWEVHERGNAMIEQMRRYYPAISEFKVAEEMLSIRAMPRSGADTRLCEVVRVSEKVLRVRAGKIDAVIEAERQIRGIIDDDRDLGGR